MEIKVVGGSMDAAEKKLYADYIREKYPDKIVKDLTIAIDGEFVNLNFTYNNVPFERIRRITGYLVGNMTRWNDAKRAEEHDRVKHC